MLEIGTSGLMSGEGKRGVAVWPKLPRLSSTLPEGARQAPSKDGDGQNGEACRKQKLRRNRLQFCARRAKQAFAGLANELI